MKNRKNVVVAIILLVVCLGFVFYRFDSGSSDLENVKNSKVKIVESKASKLKLVDYSNDVFSMKVPDGYKVDSAGVGVFYAIHVYDTADSNNSVFLMVKMQPLLKSKASKKQWQQYYKLAGGQYRLFADAVVLDKPTTESFYKKFNKISKYMNNIDSTFANFKFPTYSNFKKLEEFKSSASMSGVALDSKVLRATFTGDNNKKGEGMFLASIVNFGNVYQAGIDSSYYMVYDIVSVTANENDFVDYKDILLNSVNSIEFNDSYVKKTIDDSNAQTKKTLEINASIQRAFDSYMSAWESRNKSYDIMSQKQSDAILGYERVYDTETNDIYKAYNGFTDDYDGERYKSITDDMYSKKTSGYIEK